MVDQTIKRSTKQMAGFVTNSDKDSLMRASYYQITRNFTKTVNRFVAFKDEDRLIEIPHGIGQRSKFIDLMIKYFESLEEYEKCNKLMKLRELVMMAGD
tara:strand:- start:187 stop:483 length:297 start_codon:yes stop_codon:yes gene_type:complete